MTPRETYDQVMAAIEHTYNRAIQAAIRDRDEAMRSAVMAYEAALKAEQEGKV